MEAIGEADATGTAAIPGRRSFPPKAVLAIACVAQFMVVLDVSIVNVALPAMRNALKLSPTELQWVVNAYALGFAGLLLFGGRAADIFGAKRVFLVGVVAFTAASFAGGLAQNGTWLISARAVQGLAGAILAPATLTLIMTTFTDPKQRTSAMGIWSATMAAGGATGGLFGGLLTDVASWRWVLFVNVPIGVLLIAAATIVVPGTGGRMPAGLGGLDIPGAVTVTGGLGLVVYGIVSTDTHAWGSAAVLSPIAVGLVLLVAFLVIEARAKQPLVPLGVFRRRSLSTANALVFLIGAAMFSMWYFVSLYMQQVLHLSALQTGWGFLPASLAIIAGTTIATRLVPRIGPKPLIIIGAFASTIGLLWLSRMPGNGSYAADVLGPTMVLTFGLGLAVTPTTVAGTAGVAREQSGLASGLLNTSRQVGGALGLAVFSTVAVHLFTSRIASGHPQGAALAAGYGRAMLVAGAVTAVAALGALSLPKVTGKRSTRD